nr:hypothetical protein [Anaerolineae bacterium]
MFRKLKRREHKEELATILDQHAAAVIMGGEPADADLIDKYGQTHPELESLMGLTRRLYYTLVPTEPSEEFVEDLRTRLAQIQERPAWRRRPWPSLGYRSTKLPQLVGWALSLAALVLVIFRFTGSLILLFTFLAGRKRRLASA